MVLKKVVIQESGRKITAITTIIIIVVNDIMIISHYLSESGSCFQVFAHECAVRKNYVSLRTPAGCKLPTYLWHLRQVSWIP